MAAALTAGWFWNSDALNALADGGDETGLGRSTIEVNGGTTGLTARENYRTRAKRVLGS